MGLKALIGTVVLCLACLSVPVSSTCSSPTPVNYARYYQTPSACHYTCMEGYRMVGGQSMRSCSQGQWDPSWNPIQCVPHGSASHYRPPPPPQPPTHSHPPPPTYQNPPTYAPPPAPPSPPMYPPYVQNPPTYAQPPAHPNPPMYPSHNPPTYAQPPAPEYPHMHPPSYPNPPMYAQPPPHQHRPMYPPQAPRPPVYAQPPANSYPPIYRQPPPHQQQPTYSYQPTYPPPQPSQVPYAPVPPTPKPATSVGHACPPIVAPAHSSVTLLTTYNGATAIFHCENGYLPVSGAISRKCKNGKWEEDWDAYVCVKPAVTQPQQPHPGSYGPPSVGSYGPPSVAPNAYPHYGYGGTVGCKRRPKGLFSRGLVTKASNLFQIVQFYCWKGFVPKKGWTQIQCINGQWERKKGLVCVPGIFGLGRRRRQRQG